MLQKAADIGINCAIFEPQLASQLEYTALAEMGQVIKLFQEVFLAFHKYDNSVSYMKRSSQLPWHTSSMHAKSQRVGDKQTKPCGMALLALVGMTVTGALGAAIVYGPTADPFVTFIYHLFWAQ